MVNTIKGFIGEGNTEQAISQMAKFATSNADILNDVMLLSGQFTQANVQFNRTLVNSQTHQEAVSKINRSLLALLDEMERKGLFSDGAKPADEDESGPRTKLLFLASNPVDQQVLQLEKEYLEVRKIFKNHRNKFAITEEFDVSLDTFFEALYREKPHIIHISGFSEADGAILSNKADRTSYFVPFEYLAPAFKMLKGVTECAFFNTSNSSLVAKVVSRAIPFSIGIRGEIDDSEAISFSSGFYSALALEKNYEKAFKMGRDLAATASQDFPKSDDNQAPVQKFFLYQNGFSAEDTETPDDFYAPKEEKPKEKKR
jgi:hypothetical protein